MQRDNDKGFNIQKFNWGKSVEKQIFSIYWQSMRLLLNLRKSTSLIEYNCEYNEKWCFGKAVVWFYISWNNFIVAHIWDQLKLSHPPVEPLDWVTFNSFSFPFVILTFDFLWFCLKHFWVKNFVLFFLPMKILDKKI